MELRHPDEAERKTAASADMGRARPAVNAAVAVAHARAVSKRAPRTRPISMVRSLLAAVVLGGLLAGVAPAIMAAPGASAPIRILALGDSLTAGYGLPPETAFPVQLEAALKAKGHAVEVINAGVSGDTTAAALERFDWALPAEVDAVIVELGANDALRGLDPARARANLDAILTKIKARGVPVLLAGMSAPRNMGPEYVAAFDRMYPELAASHDAVLYPFFLAGVALEPALNQRDGIHPNARGVSVIVERMLPTIERLIARVKSQRAAAR